TTRPAGQDRWVSAAVPPTLFATIPATTVEISVVPTRNTSAHIPTVSVGIPCHSAIAIQIVAAVTPASSPLLKLRPIVIPSTGHQRLMRCQTEQLLCDTE